MKDVLRAKRRGVRPDSLHVLRGQRTRRRILDAARARILRDGYENLRLDSLAQDAGITKAAVIKSVGSKASLLLELGDEERAGRLQMIRDAMTLRSGLRRRLEHVVGQSLSEDVHRLNVVMPYFGHMWFWSGADHERAQSMLDETRIHLRKLIAAASPEPISSGRADTIALRVISGYALALRDIYYGRATVDEAIRLVSRQALETA